MAKYAEKRQRARCSSPHCIATAEKLLLVAGKPEWVCVTHYQEVSKR